MITLEAHHLARIRRAIPGPVRRRWLLVALTAMSFTLAAGFKLLRSERITADQAQDLIADAV